MPLNVGISKRTVKFTLYFAGYNAKHILNALEGWCRPYFLWGHIPPQKI